MTRGKLLSTKSNLTAFNYKCFDTAIYNPVKNYFDKDVLFLLNNRILEPMRTYPSVFQKEMNVIERRAQLNIDKNYRKRDIVIFTDSQF